MARLLVDLLRCSRRRVGRWHGELCAMYHRVYSSGVRARPGAPPTNLLSTGKRSPPVRDDITFGLRSHRCESPHSKYLNAIQLYLYYTYY